MTTIPLDVSKTTDNCRYCLMCRHTCPVGNTTYHEALTPHGWGLTIASVKRGLIDWNETTITNLFTCADCGGCRSHCVFDQPLPDAIAAARREVVEMGSAPPAVYATKDMLEKWSNPYREEAPQEPAGQGTDALFVGDEAPYLWPDALEAVRTLLQATGVTPVEIGAGRSNGYLASSLGLTDVARTIAQQTLDELAAAGVTRLFVLSAGDFYTFNQLYPERLGLAWPEGVELIEVTAFLSERLEAGDLKLKQAAESPTYAYVDPSHGVRVPDRHSSPRALAGAALSGEPKELFWREERGHPVGSTALKFSQPHIAQMLTRDRLMDAKKTGADLLVCEDPGTLSAMEALAGAFQLQVRGLYEVLAEQMEN